MFPTIILFVTSVLLPEQDTTKKGRVYEMYGIYEMYKIYEIYEMYKMYENATRHTARVPVRLPLSQLPIV